MAIYLSVIISIISLLICYQDFKDRLVSIYLYLILFLLVILTKVIIGPFSWYDLAFNTTYYTLSFGCIWLYVVFIKKGFFFEYIGMGDLLISLIWITAFQFEYLIIFNLLSLVLMLIYGLGFLRKGGTVPFAGIQAAMYAFYTWFY